MGRRSDILLSALALVAIAHGVLLGLSFFALLAIGLKVLGEGVPPVNLAIAFGALAGLGVLGISLNRQRVLREGRYRSWGFHDSADGQLLRRFESLVASSSLPQPPRLRLMESRDLNAFAVGRSRDDATVVVTTGLLDLLEPREQDAVLAHQIAHVESGALGEVGFADAVADSVGMIARLRETVLWEPGKILRETAEVWTILVVLVFLVQLMQDASGFGGLVLTLIVLVLVVALVRIALESFWGLVQAFLFVIFLGPLTVIESALELPTIVALTRLTSRTRIYEADARSVELTGEGDALVSALKKLSSFEFTPIDSDLERDLRFTLFLAPLPPEGIWSWGERLRLTHPVIAERIDAIGSRGPKPAPAAAERT
jgi:Zn-dependent protease with chaperone function